MKTEEVLKKVKEEYESLAGSYNGDERSYWHEGEVYSEEQASVAQEIAEKVTSLLESLKEFQEV